MKPQFLLIALILFFITSISLFAQPCQIAGAGFYTDQDIDVAGCNGQSINAPYQAWAGEMYFTVVQAGGNYTFELVGCSQSAWGAPVSITVWEGSTSDGPGGTILTGGTAIATASGVCDVTFTASASDTVFFVVTTTTGCGNPVQQIDNGVATVTTNSGVSCGTCGDAVCDSPGEDYCNCVEDCDCMGGASVFADMFPTISISPDPVVYCPSTLGDTSTTGPFQVFIPIAPFSSASLPSCVTGWHISTTEGSLFRSTAIPTPLMPGDTVNELIVFYLAVSDADIAAAAGGITTVTFTDATGPGTCEFTLDIDWNDTIVDDDGNPWAGSATDQCGCRPPMATLVDYDCNTNTLTFNVNDVGLPSSGSMGFTWLVEDGSASPIVISDTGNYSFVLDDNTRSWDIIASDSVNDACDVGFFRVYPDCRVVCNGGTDLIVEGDFETVPTVAWSEVSESQSGPTGNSVVNLINPVFGALDGSGAAIMGALGLTAGADTLYHTEISQVVSIPDNASSALHFWAWMIACDSSADMLTVSVNSNVELVIDGGDVRCGDGNWYEYSIDLTAYAGGADDTLKFEVNEFELNGGSTVIFIDEVVLEECVDCPPVLNLAGATSGDITYRADTINTRQSVTDPDSVNYLAGEEVNLQSDFETQLGSIVIAEIEDCAIAPPIIPSPSSQSLQLPEGIDKTNLPLTFEKENHRRSINHNLSSNNLEKEIIDEYRKLNKK